MAIFGIGLRLSALVACFIVSLPFVQGRSLRRRHDHHSRTDYYDFEGSMPRILSRRLEDNTDLRDSYNREYPESLDRSSSENPAEIRLPYARRYKHEYDSRKRDSLRRDKEPYDDFASSTMRFVARKKRHNKHGDVSYRRITDQEKRSLLKNRQRNRAIEVLQSAENDGFHAAYELEVKEAQNSSICNYTIESIPDNRGSRMPKDLEHIRCNHVGSSCQGTGAYCCIQTYKNIEVSYGDGDRETMKIYVGCVCAALQDFNSVRLIESHWPIND